MSIERQLTDAFRSNESWTECPPSLDARIMADYRRLAMEKRGSSSMKSKKRLTRVALIALVVAVLCGFAYAGTKLLYSDSQGHYSIRMQSNKALTLDPDTLEHVRTTLKEVQTQLAPGETAVVYLPDVFPGNLPIGVTNPDYISDVEQWKSVLREHGMTLPLPVSLLEGTYRFAEGAVGNPFHFSLGPGAADLMKEMKAEKRSTDEEGPLWRLTDTPVDIHVSYYTSVFRDTNHETIYFTWEVIEDSSIQIDGFTAASTEYTELQLDGRKVHYTKNPQLLSGESSVHQDVMWIEEQRDQTIVYHVESDSANMTKERLIEVAESLL